MMRRDAVGLVAAAGAIAAALIRPVHAADVDWKMYGATGAPNANICFYDANGVVKLSDHVRFWTKCLIQRELDF